MSNEFLLRSLGFAGFVIIVLSTTQNRCPGESEPMFIGYRKGDECISFTKIPSTASYKKYDATYTLNELCGQRFKNGRRHGFLYGSEVQHTAKWRKSLSKIRCAGHFIIWNRIKYNCWEVFFRWGNECRITVLYQAYDKTETAVFRFLLKYFTSSYNPDGSDEPLRRFESYEYYNWIATNDRFPICPTYYMSSDGYSDADPMFCMDDNFWGKDIYVACKHSPYKNCIFVKKPFCHYHESDGEWYKYDISVTQQPEPPYGLKCPSDIPKEWKVVCEKNCLGNWGEWSREPSEEHLKCDSVTLVRYMPHDVGAPPCYEASNTCCVGRMVKKYEVNCTDFAYNTTINLQKKGCKNGGTRTRDARGHLKCACTDQYVGIQCEKDVCKDYCQHGGTCIPGKGQPNCFCRRGFKGRRCEKTVKSCGELGDCKNGGVCESTMEGTTKLSYCKCAEGFGGSSCEHRVEKCTEDSCNSHGVCQEDKEYHSIKCICYESYGGDRCELKNGQKIANMAFKPNMSNMANLMIGLILGFLLLALCFGGAAVHHHKRRRRRRGHGSESTSQGSSFSTTLSRMFGGHRKHKGTSRTTKTKDRRTQLPAGTNRSKVGTSTDR